MHRLRLSLVASLSVAAALLLGGSGTTPAAAADAAPAPAPAAPYLEMGGANGGNLDAGIDAGLTNLTAAFVIGRGCTPIWDTGISVAKDTAVTNAITNAQARGVQVIVSFGGAGGQDLARSCSDLTQLTAAYQSVIDKLHVSELDFDVEGKAIKAHQQQASIARRFAAIRTLEAQNPGLVVSATIGVGPQGLPPGQLSFLEVAKSSDTRIDLVNIMTMDYGGAVKNMGATAVQSAQGTLKQVQGLWPADTYANLGITPMIGQNDSAGEVTSLADARTIVSFAADNGVGRVAFWSLNRDQQCSADRWGARGDCAGVKQAPLAFTTILLGG